MSREILVTLSGGTGSSKLVRGLQLAGVKSGTAIINVADNFRHLGLYIAPDIDTILYCLAGRLDERRGWGIRGDTFNFLQEAKRIGLETWFQIGDRDLALHVFRTKLRHEGVPLSEITARLAAEFGVTWQLLPATDDFLETTIVSDGRRMHFQEFWVKQRGEGTVEGVNFEGASKAQPAPGVEEAIHSADGILVCPGNPVTSIGPILAVPHVRTLLSRAEAPKLAVSPIIGTLPVSGPAGKLMQALGLEVSVKGIAEYYAGIVDGLVIDHSDCAQAPALKRMGLSVMCEEILMANREAERRLAKKILSNVEKIR